METMTKPTNRGGRPRGMIPTLYHHKASGQAYVRVNGRTTNLGASGSPDTEVRYKAFVEEYLASGGIAAPAVVVQRIETRTVAQLADRYLAHTDGYYRKRGEPTSQAATIRKALTYLHQAGLTGLPVESFGPKTLKEFQAWMVKGKKGRPLIDPATGEAGLNPKTGKPRREPILDPETGEPVPLWCRTTINRYAEIIVAMFKWGVGEELLPETVWRALTAVRGLAMNRSPIPGVALREAEPVTPVEDADLTATLSELPPTLVAMVTVQALCAMRPAEVCHMRKADLSIGRDESGGVDSIVYAVAPEWNKTEHKRITRRVFLGPKAAAIVLPLLDGLTPEEHVFSPRRAITEWDTVQNALRKPRTTKRFPCEVKRVAKAKAAAKRRDYRETVVGDCYTPTSYRVAIQRACRRAGVGLWSPNQLRHTGATRYADAQGLDVARMLLGHADARTTKRYVQEKSTKQIAAARELA